MLLAPLKLSFWLKLDCNRTKVTEEVKQKNKTTTPKNSAIEQKYKSQSRIYGLKMINR